MQKKLLVSTLVLVLATGAIAAAQAAVPIKIVVDGQELATAVAPLLVEGRVLAPVRALAEKLGAEVTWDGEKSTVYINSPVQGGKAASAVAEVAAVVEEFGQALQKVSLLAPEDVLSQSMQDNYGKLVAPQLLEAWAQDPASAPGRLLSSPWPEGIEILKLEKIDATTYQVTGEIIEVTGETVAVGGFAAKRSITLVVAREGEGWLITAISLGDYGEGNPNCLQQ